MYEEPSFSVIRRGLITPLTVFWQEEHLTGLHMLTECVNGCGVVMERWLLTGMNAEEEVKRESEAQGRWENPRLSHVMRPNLASVLRTQNNRSGTQRTQLHSYMCMYNCM
jgi:hypothetical protein